MPPVRITLASVVDQLPPRATAGHKGTFGRVALVAGSPDTPGAAVLCALGALRSGVGLVRWATQMATVQMAPTRPPELMLSLREHVSGAEDASVWAQHILQFGPTLVVGCGLGQTDHAQATVEAILRHARAPLCLDADALNILALRPELWALLPPRSILTPHPKETARLTGQKLDAVMQAPVDTASALAAQTHCIVILKASGTTIAAPDGRVAQTFDAGISALGHGGTGDVLAGLVGGLLAQDIDPYLAAQTAVVVHRAAGAKAAESFGHAGVMASDVAHAVGHIWARCGR